MATTDLAAWATVCGLMTVFLSLGVAALGACVIPQDNDTPPWVAVQIAAQSLAVITGVIGVWVAMSY